MQVGMPIKKTVWALRFFSLLLLIFATCFWHGLGFLIALLFILFLAKVWPKWAYELAWDDIYMAICNLAVYGINGSRLHIHLKRRRIFVYKDIKNKKLRLAVVFFEKEWKDIFSKTQDVKYFAKQHNAVCNREYYPYRKHTFFLKPKDKANQEKECFIMLKQLCELSGESLDPDVIACVDSIERFAWQRYDEVKY